MERTANLHLGKPTRGTPWLQPFNDNSDTIDAAVTAVDDRISDVLANITDSPEVYYETGTFNGPTGTVIALPKSVSAITEYGVTVVPTARTDSIGDIYVDRGLSSVTVKCSASNTTDTFLAVIWYKGELNAYGNSQYREWFVSPDDAITDHGDSSVEGSLAWVCATMVGLDVSSDVRLPGGHTYQLLRNLTIPSQVRLKPDFTAIVKTTQIVGGGGSDWTLYSGSIYSSTTTYNEPATLYEDGVALTKVATIGDIDAAGKWAWDGSLHVWTTGGVDPDTLGAVSLVIGFSLTVEGTLSVGAYDRWLDASPGNLFLTLNASQKVPPDWWGTDGLAIQCAADAVKYITLAGANGSLSGGLLVFRPGGVYSSDRSLFFGGTLSECVRFINGHGALIQSTVNGEPAIDYTGAFKGHWSDLNLNCLEVDTPNVGILLARNSTGLSAGNHLFEKVNVSGYVDYSLVYNYASEASTWVECIFNLTSGQSTAILTRSNSRSITSPGTAITTGNKSSTNPRFIRCSFWNNTAAAATADDSCLEIDSFRDGLLENCSFSLHDSYQDKPAIRVLNNGSWTPDNWSIKKCRIDTIVAVGIQFECPIVYHWTVAENHWGSVTNGPSNSRYQIKNTVATVFYHCFFAASNIDLSVSGSHLRDGCTIDASLRIQTESEVTLTGDLEGTVILRDDSVFTYDATLSTAKVEIPSAGISYRHNPLVDMDSHSTSGAGSQDLTAILIGNTKTQTGSTLVVSVAGTIVGTAGTKTIAISIAAVTWTIVDIAADVEGDYTGELRLKILNDASDVRGKASGGVSGYPSYDWRASSTIDFSVGRNVIVVANPESASDIITNEFFELRIE